MTDDISSEHKKPFWKDLKIQVIGLLVLAVPTFIVEHSTSILEKTFFNKNPKASFKITEPVVVNKFTTFDARDSYDPDPEGEIKEYRWKLITDEKEDEKKNKFETVDHKFTKPGIVRVELTVKDEYDNIDSYERTFEVINPAKSPPPEAKLTTITSKDNRKVDNSILFSAIGSTAPPDEKLSYQWTVMDVIQTEFSQDNIFSHSFEQSGEYYVLLTVKSSSSQVSQAITSVVIKENDLKKEADKKKSSETPPKNLYIAKISNLSGFPVKLNDELNLSAEDSNLATKDGKNTYHWTLKNEKHQDELKEQEGEKVKFLIAKPGNYTVSVEIKRDGNIKGEKAKLSFYVEKPDFQYKVLSPQVTTITRYGAIDTGLVAWYSKHPLDRKVDLRLLEEPNSGNETHKLEFGEQFKINGIETLRRFSIGSRYYYLKLQPLAAPAKAGFNNFALGSMKLNTDCSKDFSNQAVESAGKKSYTLKLQNEGTCQNWKSTGIKLNKGMPYRIKAQGHMTLGEKAKQAGPQGVSYSKWQNNYSYLMHENKYENVGLLVGRLGREGDIFSVGECMSFEADKDGILYLNLNDIHMSNNHGEFKITVEEGYKNISCKP
ncbi:PKD domain-containing protein [Thalassomonas sp. RHCl1]|uniref:PKD domain-containing protein n=1 Tax=Thalassomonas sp. RHCl1 TaxID=2995320 RepID=UPI00248C0DAD|nr:PKD domain-containing protein [Thalassomonas sp. RHCl1]